VCVCVTSASRASTCPPPAAMWVRTLEDPACLRFPPPPALTLIGPAGRSRLRFSALFLGMGAPMLAFSASPHP
jgi:hypothetical protein